MKIPGKAMLAMAGVLLIMLLWGIGGCNEEPAAETKAIALARDAMSLASEAMFQQRVNSYLADLLGGIGFLVAISLPAIALGILVLMARRSSAEAEAMQVIELADDLVEMSGPLPRLGGEEQASLPSPEPDQDVDQEVEVP